MEFALGSLIVLVALCGVGAALVAALLALRRVSGGLQSARHAAAAQVFTLGWRIALVLLGVLSAAFVWSSRSPGPDQQTLNSIANDQRALLLEVNNLIASTRQTLSWRDLDTQVGPFSEGHSCGKYEVPGNSGESTALRDEELAKRAQDLAQQIAHLATPRGSVILVQVQGGFDAMPLSDAARRHYGSNYVLAEKRARCVVDWMNLASGDARRSSPLVDVKVVGPEDLGEVASRAGNDADRAVRVRVALLSHHEEPSLEEVSRE